jgi:hypothetical protein
MLPASEPAGKHPTEEVHRQSKNRISEPKSAHPEEGLLKFQKLVYLSMIPARRQGIEW